MHNSLVGMGSCKQRVSAGRSGGKTGGASHNGDSLEYVYSEGEQV